MRTKMISKAPRTARASSLTPTILERSYKTHTRRSRITILGACQLVYTAVILRLTFDDGEVDLSRWVAIG